MTSEEVYIDLKSHGKKVVAKTFGTAALSELVIILDDVRKRENANSIMDHRTAKEI